MRSPPLASPGTFTLKPSLVVVLTRAPWLMLLTLGAAAGGIVYLLTFTLAWAIATAAGWLVLGLGMVWLSVWAPARYVLTSERIESREGLIARSIRVMPVANMQHVVVRQGFIERLTGTGTVLLASAGTGTYAMVWRTIRDPNAWASKIRTFAAEAASGAKREIPLPDMPAPARGKHASGGAAGASNPLRGPSSVAPAGAESPPDARRTAVAARSAAGVRWVKPAPDPTSPPAPPPTPTPAATRSPHSQGHPDELAANEATVVGSGPQMPGEHAHAGTTRSIHEEQPMVLGLVGGIGAGKSEVARVLAKMEFLVVDADKDAKAALDRPQVRDQLVAWWGEGVLLPADGASAERSIDRRKVAAIVFQDPEQRRRLEGLVHPIVRSDRAGVIARAKAMGKAGVVIDAPLLFEAGSDKECDAVLFVDAPRRMRLERVKARGWSDDELDKREAAQMPLDEKRRRSHAVVMNDSDLPTLRRRVDEAVAKVRARRAETGLA